MLYAIVAVIALILDQAVKYWTTVNVVLDTGMKKFIPGLVHIANIHNTGAAFSFLEGARWFFVILCLIFLAIVIYALLQDLIETPIARWAAVFVAAGAVGNCIDRIVCGFVVDMFELEFMHFPVFNIADIYITIGAIVFCLCLFLEKKPGTQKSAIGAAKEAKAEKAGHAEHAAAAAAAPAEKAPEEKPAGLKKPPFIRSHKKVVIPEFPKHTAIPAVEPNPEDPFAEWERKANPPAEPEPAPAPAPAPAVVPAAPPPPAAPAAPQPVVKTPAAPPAPAKEAAPADEFDLDAILAEFHDL